MIGIMVPNVFAETDSDDVILFTSPNESFTVELPCCWYYADTETHLFQEDEQQSMIRMIGWTLLEDYELTDRDIHNEMQHQGKWYCVNEVYDDEIFEWAGCYDFQKIDKEVTYTNEGRKVWMMDMKYNIYGKIHSINAHIFDGRSYVEIISRTTIDGSKADPETLQQIKEIIKSFVFLNPTTEPDLKPEPEAEEPELEITIPDWVKNNAGWWANGNINDASFLEGISYLIQNNIIVIPSTESGSGGGEVPEWIKNTAGWWADGTIDDETFVNAITYLIQQGLIQV